MNTDEPDPQEERAHTPAPKTKTMGAPPPNILELARIEDRISFAYFERCTINCVENAITITDASGVIRLPAASLSVLLLGPGTSMTHKAMVTIGENGVTVIWVGERGVRMYAFGRPLTHSAALLQRQANLFRIHGRVLRLLMRCIRCVLPMKTLHVCLCNNYVVAKELASVACIVYGRKRPG